MWKKIKIKDICKVFNDGNWIESKDQSIQGIRLIQTGNIKLGIFSERKDKARYISEKTFKRLNCREVFAGDILISRLPEPVGRACIIPELSERAITAVDCTIIRVKENCLPIYLNYFFQSSQYFLDINNHVTGATRQRISRKNLGEIFIPLPPLVEQEHIIAQLDKIFLEINKKDELIKQNIKNAEKLKIEFVSKILDKLDKSDLKKLSSVCDLTRGPFGGSLTKAMFVKDGYAVFEQKHAIRDNFETIKYFISEKKFNEMKRFELKSGDLLMSCSGTLGKIAVVPKNIKKGIINQALLKITPNAKIISKEYLKLVISSEYFQKILSSFSQGAAQTNVPSVKILKNILIPVPKIDEQIKILDKISIIENLKLDNLYKERKKLTKYLKFSIINNFIISNNKAA